jgi:hypothetical protein
MTSYFFITIHIRERGGGEAGAAAQILASRNKSRDF